jgi:hypothetical protein
MSLFRELPVVELKGRTYTVDERLVQFRNRDNPVMDVIQFPSRVDMIMFLTAYSVHGEKKALEILEDIGLEIVEAANG